MKGHIIGLVLVAVIAVGTIVGGWLHSINYPDPPAAPQEENVQVETMPSQEKEEERKRPYIEEDETDIDDNDIDDEDEYEYENDELYDEELDTEDISIQEE